MDRPLAATDISSTSLIRPGSVKHSTSFDQRFLDLDFTRNGPTLSVDAPDRRLAPPGDYMMLLISPAGVPPVARWIHVG